jgi:hypothetical protein
MSASQETPAGDKDKDLERKFRWGFSIIGIALIVGFGGGCVYFTQTADEREINAIREERESRERQVEAAGFYGDEAGAISECVEAVKEILKAPATASFSGEKASRQGRQNWRVVGVVDAENSFGALIRSEWDCEVQAQRDGTWGPAEAVVIE